MCFLKLSCCYTFYLYGDVYHASYYSENLARGNNNDTLNVRERGFTRSTHLTRSIKSLLLHNTYTYTHGSWQLCQSSLFQCLSWSAIYWFFEIIISRTHDVWICSYVCYSHASFSAFFFSLTFCWFNYI